MCARFLYTLERKCALSCSYSSVIAPKSWLKFCLEFGDDSSKVMNGLSGYRNHGEDTKVLSNTWSGSTWTFLSCQNKYIPAQKRGAPWHHQKAWVSLCRARRTPRLEANFLKKIKLLPRRARAHQLSPWALLWIQKVLIRPLKVVQIFKQRFEMLP